MSDANEMTSFVPSFDDEELFAGVPNHVPERHHYNFYFMKQFFAGNLSMISLGATNSILTQSELLQISAFIDKSTKVDNDINEPPPSPDIMDVDEEPEQPSPDIANVEEHDPSSVESDEDSDEFEEESVVEEPKRDRTRPGIKRGKTPRMTPMIGKPQIPTPNVKRGKSEKALDTLKPVKRKNKPRVPTSTGVAGHALMYSNIKNNEFFPGNTILNVDISVPTLPTETPDNINWHDKILSIIGRDLHLFGSAKKTKLDEKTADNVAFLHHYYRLRSSWENELNLISEALENPSQNVKLLKLLKTKLHLHISQLVFNQTGGIVDGQLASSFASVGTSVRNELQKKIDPAQNLDVLFVDYREKLNVVDLDMACIILHALDEVLFMELDILLPCFNSIGKGKTENDRYNAVLYDKPTDLSSLTHFRETSSQYIFPLIYFYLRTNTPSNFPKSKGKSSVLDSEFSDIKSFGGKKLNEFWLFSTPLELRKQSSFTQFTHQMLDMFIFSSYVPVSASREYLRTFREFIKNGSFLCSLPYNYNTNPALTTEISGGSKEALKSIMSKILTVLGYNYDINPFENYQIGEFFPVQFRNIVENSPKLVTAKKYYSQYIEHITARLNQQNIVDKKNWRRHGKSSKEKCEYYEYMIQYACFFEDKLALTLPNQNNPELTIEEKKMIETIITAARNNVSKFKEKDYGGMVTAFPNIVVSIRSLFQYMEQMHTFLFLFSKIHKRTYVLPTKLMDWKKAKLALVKLCDTPTNKNYVVEATKFVDI